MLNAKEAAERLGVSPHTIRRFIKEGHLPDHAKAKAKGKRHRAKLQVKDLNALRGRIVPGRTPKVLPVASDVSIGHSRTPEAPKPNGKYVSIVDEIRATLPSNNGAQSRLERIEAKLDQLLAMWR